MKIILTKSKNKNIVTLSRKDWEYIGRTAGWSDALKALPQSPHHDVFDPNYVKNPNQNNQDKKNTPKIPNYENELGTNFMVSDKVKFKDQTGIEKDGEVIQLLPNDIVLVRTPEGDLEMENKFLSKVTV